MKTIHILFLSFIWLTMACHHHDHNHDHDHGHDHGHDHDDIKLFLSAYNDSYEVFAEADPLAVGIPSVLLVHITRLQDFKPLQAGRITASFESSNQSTSQTREAPERSGIYRFTLTPEETGMTRLKIAIHVDGAEEILVTEPLLVSSNAHAAIHVAEDLMVDIPGAIIFTKEQSWAVEFSTGPVSKEFFGPVIKTVGEVMPAIGDETVLTAKTNGTIRFAGNTFYEGSFVESGTPLLHIQGEALAEGNAAVRYQEARNNFQRAEADYQRISELAASKIVSEKEVLQAKNDYENARVTFENLQHYFTESGQTISSPWRGHLKEVLVHEGQFVTTGQPLMSVVRNNKLVIRAEVQQQYAGLLDHIEGVHIGIQGKQIQDSGQSGGKVLSVARNLNPQTGMLAVYLQANDQTDLIPGSLADVFLKTTSAESILVVPNTALIEEQGNYFVFVQVHPESFVKRQVHAGQSDGLFTGIAKGLTEGERVITSGAIMVKMAASSGNLDPHAGHIH